MTVQYDKLIDLERLEAFKGMCDDEYAAGAHTHSYAGAPTSGGNADRSNAILFGSVDATSTATAFTATVAGLDALTDGTAVYLRNHVVTSAAGFTVNVNNLGAKKCYNNLTNATQDTTIFNIAYSMLFIYDSSLDGGNGGWWIYRGYDGNTNTIGYQVRTNSGNKVAADTGYRYRLWFTSADGSKWVPANTSTSTNATSNRSLNTRAIDPFGPIVYRSTNGTCNADAGLGATGIWQQYTLSIGYSYMASGFSLSFPDSVYLRCTPQADGSAVMQDIVQALPSSKDGKIYIHLGTAYSATNMELQTEHPVYWHDGTGIRIWTGAEPSSGGGSASTFYASGTGSVTISDTATTDTTAIAGKPYYKSLHGTYSRVSPSAVPSNPAASGLYEQTRTTTITIALGEWGKSAGDILNVYMASSASMPTKSSPDTYSRFYLVVNNEQFEIMYDKVNISASTNTQFSNIFWDDGDVLTFVFDGSCMQYVGSSLSGRVIRSVYSDSDGSDGNIAFTYVTAGGVDWSANMYGTMYAVYMNYNGMIPATYSSPGVLAFKNNSSARTAIAKPGYISSWQDHPLTWKAGEVLLFSYNSLSTSPVLVSAPSWMASLNGQALPSVTSSDNGKVMSVVGGTWTAASPSGAAYSPVAVSIPASAWSGTTATVSVTGVTASNDVIVAPASASTTAWAAARIYCSAQGAGTLTFTCSAAPSVDVTANVMIWTQ